MMRMALNPSGKHQLTLAVALLVTTVGGSFVVAQQGDAEQKQVEGEVRVGRLVYGGGKTGACFAAGFLETVDRETDAVVHREFVSIEASSTDIFKHPFVIMTGEGDFKMSDEEIANLSEYLERGGLLLASAGCSDAAWAAAFERALKALFPEGKLVTISKGHAIFSTLYDIDAVVPKRGEGEANLLGLSIGDRLAVIYSPRGLNDTGNANVLVYSLTH